MKPATITDALDKVTVLWADLAGFATSSVRLSPAEVVAIVWRIFLTGKRRKAFPKWELLSLGWGTLSRMLRS
jgi:hypothetical protein